LSQLFISPILSIFSVLRLATYVSNSATDISKPKTYISRHATTFFAAKVQKSIEWKKDLLRKMMDNCENCNHVVGLSRV
jgi:hypothetical protein